MTRARMLLMLAAAVAALVPARAPAAPVCTAVSDPAGDVGGPGNAFGIVSGRPQPSSIDIRRIAAGIDGDDLTVVVTVAGLSRSGPSDFYVVSWSYAGRDVSVTAQRNDGGWAFGWSTYDDNVSSSGIASGAVDAAARTIAISIPRPAAGSPADSSVLQSLQASSSNNADESDLLSSYSSDFTSAVNYRLRGDCAPQLASADVCGVVADGSDDVSTAPSEKADPQIDISALGLGANATALWMRIGARDVQPEVTDGIDHEYWRVSWLVGEAPYSAEVARSRGSDPRFTVSTPSATYEATGVVDWEADALTIVADRDALGLPDDTRLTNITASSGNGSMPWLTSSSDFAPDSGDGGLFVVGAACGADPLVCPPVTDVAGDAGPIVFANGVNIPENQPALDLLSAGGASTADDVTVAVRVADSEHPLSAGWDAAGWTISWTKGENERYFAQAYRTSSGSTFSYGVDPSNGDSYVTGPSFGGTPTTGSIDATSGVISISVPRIGVGNPGDGERLGGFGATSWALHSGNTTAAFHVVDQAGVGRYPVGMSCGP